jgi:ATP-dependent RNA helicase DeaD
MQEVNFESLGLSSETLQAITAMGFQQPSPIQAQAIPPLLQGLDVIGQAQTGTGKTAAFGLPALELVDIDQKHIQVLVLCPTRELAVQVTDELRRLAQFKKGLKIETVYGGDSIERQIRSLRGGVHIVVGTPGRTMDLMERRALKLDKVEYVVLDEADEMLDMGFREDIENILEDIPAERQTVLFSATMSKPIMALTQKFQNDPVLIKITKKEVTNENIEQVYFEVKQRGKSEVTCRLIDAYDLKQIIIFCNTKRKVDEITEELSVRGYAVEALHGDLRQTQRNNVMAKFRAGTASILIATDVAARGIDVSDIDAVINFDLPLDEEYYVHRIGRTGRAGKKGKALTLVAKDEKFRLRQIEGYTKVRIEKGVIPSFEDIVGTRKARFIELIQQTAEEGDLDLYDDMMDMLHHATGLSTQQIVAALVKLNMGIQRSELADTDLAWEEDRKFKDRNDRNSKGGRFEDRSGDRGGRFEKRGDSRDGRFGDKAARPQRNDPGMVRLFVSVGRKDRVQPRDIVGAIAGEAGIPGRVIGAIDIFDAYSFVDVPERDVRKIINAMNGNTVKGKTVNIEVAR